MKNEVVITRVLQVWLLSLGFTLLFGVVVGIVNLLQYMG
jgi:hypothetical protein